MAVPCVLAVAVLLLSAQQAAGQLAQPGISSGSRPLTCACTRELKPVCGSDGRAYDNSCLARCAGVQITDPKPRDPRNCNKVTILTPGPAGQKYNGNSNTQGGSSSSNAVSSGGGRPGRRLSRVLSQQARQPGGFGPGGCACPRIYAPVCGSDGRAYNTKCEAECVGVTITGQTPVNGVCNSGPLGPINPSGPGFNPSGPISTRPWWQGQPWPNPAAESGPGTSLLPGPGVGPGPRPGCACALLLSPVCGVDGKTYSNSCVARCNGVAVASQGKCPGGG